MLKLSLLYKATKHGDKINNFDARCHQKGNCLILIKSEYGNRFGGYKCIPFNRDEFKNYPDSNSFIF